MVDDPLHWLGMQDLASAMTGKVLIAGLGLGLVLQALRDNHEVTEIHVIERNKDVIGLMKHHMPQEDRIKIIREDFCNYIEKIGLNYIGKMYSELGKYAEEQNIKERMTKQMESAEKYKIVGDYGTVPFSSDN
jgi:16S rRNA A1518/A1519 N6-dimethyltransferase RsmA/KsgA/DIM1 with predicted DNA glycosylase/AP lyase activity